MVAATEEIGADAAAELLISTIEPGLRARSAPAHFPAPDKGNSTS